MITSAHAHESGVIFHIFPRPFKQKKIKALRPKITKLASRGSCLPSHPARLVFLQTFSDDLPVMEYASVMAHSPRPVGVIYNKTGEVRKILSTLSLSVRVSLEKAQGMAITLTIKDNPTKTAVGGVSVFEFSPDGDTTLTLNLEQPFQPDRQYVLILTAYYPPPTPEAEPVQVTPSIWIRIR